MRNERWPRQSDGGHAAPLEPKFAPLPAGTSHLRPFLLQLLLIYGCVIAWGYFAENVMGWNEVSSHPPFGPYLQLLKAAAVGLVGSALGFLLNWISPKLRTTGPWIWVPLVSILVLAILWDLYLGNSHIVGDYFYWFQPGRDEGPVLLDLLTLPAWASVCYSATVVAIPWRARPRDSGDRA
jgi:hypothetical protein